MVENGAPANSVHVPGIRQHGDQQRVRRQQREQMHNEAPVAGLRKDEQQQEVNLEQDHE